MPAKERLGHPLKEERMNHRASVAVQHKEPKSVKHIGFQQEIRKLSGPVEELNEFICGTSVQNLAMEFKKWNLLAIGENCMETKMFP